MASLPILSASRRGQVPQPRSGALDSCCLLVRADSVETRCLTPPQSDDLGEHEPHPVAGFPSGAQLGPHVIDHRLLSGDEACEVMGIGVGSGHGLPTIQRMPHIGACVLVANSDERVACSQRQPRPDYAAHLEPAIGGKPNARTSASALLRDACPFLLPAGRRVLQTGLTRFVTLFRLSAPPCGWRRLPRQTPLDRTEKHRHDGRGDNPGLYL
jgi:hypothetical protein